VGQQNFPGGFFLIFSRPSFFLEIFLVFRRASVAKDISPLPICLADAEGEPHNIAVIYGLHVALPNDMKPFTVELVPLP
jgi:hypothetical protein